MGRKRVHFLKFSILFASLQKEEERLRASIRRESQQRRMREKQHQRGLSASYLEPDRYDEEEEGEESISLAAIKNRYKGGIRGECAEVQFHNFGVQEFIFTFGLL